MARLSIRARLIVVMNVLVAAVGVTVGWVGVAVTERTVERRLVDGPARNAAELFETMRLPLSDVMMERLGLLFDAHVAAGPAGGPAVVATSLPSYETHTLERYRRRGPLPRRFEMGGTAYVTAQAPLPAPSAEGRRDGPHRLILLVEAEKVRAAQEAAASSIVWITLAAVAAATGLGLWLSGTIARPLRRLAGDMRRVAARAGETELPAASGESGRPAPRELADLSAAFDRLLGDLARARRQIARSTRLATLGQMSAAVAHELRNPLSGIRMNAQVLADELARAGRDDQALRRIIRETDRMELYLGELLTLAGGEGERGPTCEAGAPAADVRLEPVAESVLAMLDARCRHAGVTVHCDWGEAVPPVRAGETPVRQVIVNLVLNALDATPAGGTVTLATRTRPDEGAVRFSVSDTGPGVQVPDGVDLFDPFVTTKSDGVGLGLYVCRRNVEACGGRIGYATGEDGTTFWFDLPVAS
jgi:signal transduction histidine kinase